MVRRETNGRLAGKATEIKKKGRKDVIWRKPEGSWREAKGQKDGVAKWLRHNTEGDETRYIHIYI